MTAAPVRDYDQARTQDTGAYAAFFHAMLERGVYLPPSAFEAWFVSIVHTEEHVELVLAAARESARAVSRAGARGLGPAARAR
jgi:glutamate-1-semialdehyde 2,1-aminomutase